jgi:hypothetical protein
LSWKSPFDDPIPLPSGGELITLRDAGEYIAALPRKEHEALHWQAAVEALILVAESGGPSMLARIGMLRALNFGRPSPDLSPPRQKRYILIR